MSHAKHLAHAVLGAVSILAIGVVIGVFLDRMILRPIAAQENHESAALALDASHEGFLEELQEAIGLTEDQTGHVHEIFSRHQTAVNEAWSAVHERLAAAIDSVTQEIGAILDPEQRVGLHAWLLEHHGTSNPHNTNTGHESHD